MNTSGLTFDLNAPIIPGNSAVGLQLGMKKENINPNDLESFNSSRTKFINMHGEVELYFYEHFDLVFDENRLIEIELFNEYKGKLPCQVGLGDDVKDLEKAYGRWELSIPLGDRFAFPNLKGFTFAPKGADDFEMMMDDEIKWRETIAKLEINYFSIYLKRSFYPFW